MFIDEVKENSNSRSYTVEINGKRFQSPLFFPSISSVKPGIKTINYLLQFVSQTKPTSLLVSAYDLTHNWCNSVRHLVSTSLVCLDSGGFELRNRKINKKWNIRNYKMFINICQPDFAISFDHPQVSFKEQISLFKEVVDLKADTFRILEFAISDIPHLRWRSSYGIQQYLLKRINQVLNIIDPYIIGIPEYVLGKNLESRARTVAKISKLLRKRGPYYMLHILGCGDPIAIRQYFLKGADFFDGTSWYRYLIDPFDGYKRKNIYDYDMECSCAICGQNRNLNDYDRLLMHNLRAYMDFTIKLSQDQGFGRVF